MLDDISSLYGHAIVGQCDEHCRMVTGRRPRAVILKGERIDFKNVQKMCDCVIFRDDLKIVLVELKGKNLQPRSIHEKLGNAARVALKIWSEVSDKSPTLFFVVAAKSYADHMSYLRISRDRITINGQDHPIRTAKCGCKMAEIIKDYK